MSKHQCQELYYEIASTEVLRYRFRVYIVVAAAVCCEQLA